MQRSMSAAGQAPPLTTTAGGAQPLPGSLTEAEQELVQSLRAKYSQGRVSEGERRAALGRRRHCTGWHGHYCLKQTAVEPHTPLPLSPLVLQALLLKFPSQLSRLQSLHAALPPQTAATRALPAAAPAQRARATMGTAYCSTAAPTVGAKGRGGGHALAYQTQGWIDLTIGPQTAKH